MFIRTTNSVISLPSKAKEKDGKSELQVIVSFNKPEDALEINHDRRQIKIVFRSLKTIGFNIEDTHKTETERIQNLFASVTAAFV
jgi:hypothetical protein